MTWAFFIVILYQAYCFYHIYKSQDKAYWYIIILLFPFIGGLIYFLRKASMGGNPGFDLAARESIAPSISPTRISQLEEQVELADTVTNKILLADAYAEKGNYTKAIGIYESCFNKFTEDDEELNVKLLSAYYHNNDYVNTIAFGKKLESYKFFANAKEKTYYAWAYFELNDDDMAEKVFEEMNIQNTNFYHRLEYVKFLIETERHSEANIIIIEMMSEFRDMDAFQRKGLREVFKETKLIKEKVLSS